jgi:hypothetical protein
MQQAQGAAAGAEGMPDSYWKTGNVGWSGAAAQDDGVGVVPCSRHLLLPWIGSSLHLVTHLSCTWFHAT